MNDSINDVVWKAYSEQNEMGHDIIISLPDNRRIFALGSILAAKAPALIALMNTEISPKEIDLSTCELSSNSIKGVLDFVHGAHDIDPPRVELAQDFLYLCSLLHAADYCGAQSCKSWVENVMIKDHISNLEPNELRRLTEDARARHADRLYEAASEELAKRAPVDVLHNASSDVLAEIVDRHVEKRQRRIQELAVGTLSGNLLIFDTATGSSLRTVDAHGDCINCVAYSFDNSTIATASSDHTARLWNADTYACLHTLQHVDLVWAVAFSKLNRSVVASCGRDRTCKIWNISNGECLKTLEHSGATVFMVAWSPSNETQLASGANDNIVRIWNTDTSDCVELEGHEGEINSIAYALDGITLVSASCDHTCRLWDVSNGTQLRVFRGGTDEVGHVVFSPNDGTVFASVGNDTTIRIWHTCTGSCIREIIGTSIAEDTRLDSVVLAYSPDGTVLACGMTNSNNELWRIGLLDVNTAECVRTIDIAPDVGEPYFVAFRPPIPTEATLLSS